MSGWSTDGWRGLRWLWLDKVFSGLMRGAGRAGGGISDDTLLWTGTGATDGWREALRVETKFGFGVEDAPR